MKVAFYGGSFDPPHIAHIASIEAILKNLDIDLLIVMVAYQNPLKNPPMFSDTQRYQWMKQACVDLEAKAIELYQKKIIISDYEIKNRIFFTHESISFIEESMNTDKIYLVLGSDNFSSFLKWEGYENLRQKVEFVFLRRQGFMYNMAPYKEIALDGVKQEISSTWIKEQSNAEILRMYLPQSIVDSVLAGLRTQKSNDA